MLDLFKVLEMTTVEGPGNRFCIWTQGCKKHCKGCWAVDTWSFWTGKKYNVSDLYAKIKSTDNIEGVTFLGGEPFEQAEELSKLASLIKADGLSIVCFTGYSYEELSSVPFADELLKYVDLLIDGGFEKDKFDLSRPWVGSSNQRYIFLTDFYSIEDVKKYKNKIEARISSDGKLEINGMGDFYRLKEKFCLQHKDNGVK